MKKTILSACLLATTLLGVAPLASAMTYTNGDLFLVFRQSQSSANDVEFNIGSISNYLGLTRGTVVPVTAWNSNQVLSAYGAATWTDVINNDGKFVLVAATPYVPNSPSSVCWITDGDAGTTPTMVSGSALSTMISKVRQVAADAYQLAGNGNQYLSIAPGNQGSYSYDVSYGTGLSIPNLGSASAFTVEQFVPATMNLYQIQATNVNPKPAATLIGSFALSASGSLTFTAGAVPPVPTVSSVAGGSGLISVSFASTLGVNYRLVYSTTVNGPVTGWTLATGAGSGPVSGNGGTMTLTDTITGGARFYAIQAY